jgi:protein gp37
MGKNSAIEWTTHSFAPWIGCQHVSPGCDLCYAEKWANRYKRVAWGPHGTRKRTSPAMWKAVPKWPSVDSERGGRAKIFCSELADVFDNKAPDGARDDCGI